MRRRTLTRIPGFYKCIVETWRALRAWMRGSFAANQIDDDIPNRQLVANSGMMAGNFRLYERYSRVRQTF